MSEAVREKKKITPEEMDKIFETVDMIPPNTDYFPTIEDFKRHNVAERLDEECFAAFVVWLQESMSKREKSEQEMEVDRYITKMFQDYI